MPVVHPIYVTTGMIKSLKYIYNKGLISSIKTLYYSMMSTLKC